MAPLTDRLRPNTLEDFVGQKHLVGKGKPLRVVVESRKLYSMIFWGPPGCGKTTLAHILAKAAKAHFVSLSAVDSEIKDTRKVIKEARFRLGFSRQIKLKGQGTS